MKKAFYALGLIPAFLWIVGAFALYPTLGNISLGLMSLFIFELSLSKIRDLS